MQMGVMIEKMVSRFQFFAIEWSSLLLKHYNIHPPLMSSNTFTFSKYNQEDITRAVLAQVVKTCTRIHILRDIYYNILKYFEPVSPDFTQSWTILLILRPWWYTVAMKTTITGPLFFNQLEYKDYFKN